MNRRRPVRVELTRVEARVLYAAGIRLCDRDIRALGYTGHDVAALGRALDKLALARSAGAGV